MGRFIVTRLVSTLPVLIVGSILIFGSVRAIPGNVCILVLGTPEVTEEQCNTVHHRLGLDKSAGKQYLDWMGGILQGDFGNSLISQRPVLGEVRRRLNVTLQLSIFASVFSAIIAIPIGVYSALKRDKPADHLLRLVTVGWLSMPSFWVATMLLTFPAKWWGYSPPVGFSQLWEDPLKNLQQIYLPVLALGLSLSASLARLVRSSMLEVLRQDYVRTARAKGLTERVVLSRHALKNAMLPAITLFGLQFGWTLGGVVVIESIFGLPGLGSLLLQAVILKDYTLIQGVVLFFVVSIVLINLLVDLTYAWLDPRIRYS